MKRILAMLLFLLCLTSACSAELQLPADSNRWLRLTEHDETQRIVYLDKHRVNFSTKDNSFSDRQGHLLATIWLNAYDFTKNERAVIRELYDLDTSEFTMVDLIVYDDSGDYKEKYHWDPNEMVFEMAPPETMAENLIMLLKRVHEQQK